MINIENVRRYCSNYEQIENYQEAINSPEIWDCHHRNEIDMNLSKEELKKRGMYYNRPASELIFLTHGGHVSLHHKGKIVSNETKKKISNVRKGMIVSNETRKKLSDAHRGKTVSDETKKKMSDAQKGKNSHMYGKHLSEETRKKISDAHKGENHPMYGKHHSTETKKKMSDSKKGENNPMYGKHLSIETKKKMSDAHKGDKNSTYKFICPIKLTYMYCKQGMSANQIAKEIGISRKTILSKLRELNIPIRKR